MMEALSSQNCPSREDSIAYVINHLSDRTEPIGISSEDLRIVVTMEYEKMLRKGGFGSMAAWYHISAPMLINNVRLVLEKKYRVSIERAF